MCACLKPARISSTEAVWVEWKASKRSFAGGRSGGGGCGGCALTRALRRANSALRLSWASSCSRRLTFSRRAVSKALTKLDKIVKKILMGQPSSCCIDALKPKKPERNFRHLSFTFSYSVRSSETTGSAEAKNLEAISTNFGLSCFALLISAFIKDTEELNALIFLLSSIVQSTAAAGASALRSTPRAGASEGVSERSIILTIKCIKFWDESLLDLIVASFGKISGRKPEASPRGVPAFIIFPTCKIVLKTT
mmetsp:Transcript_12350/g.15007  ORF Transcript_12350/g.15007 Transcript_12350/m.15007 type:complete len:252 (+) Transcript_12350:417-1172(+)